MEAYIASGEPVASRTVSRLRGSELSAASIRNVMADLVEEGFLAQPHTSAGRVPTAKAFQSYVQVLSGKRLPSADMNRVRNELRMADTVEAKVECSSHLPQAARGCHNLDHAVIQIRAHIAGRPLIALPNHALQLMELRVVSRLASVVGVGLEIERHRTGPGLFIRGQAMARRHDQIRADQCRRA